MDGTRVMAVLLFAALGCACSSSSSGSGAGGTGAGGSGGAAGSAGGGSGGSGGTAGTAPGSSMPVAVASDTGAFALVIGGEDLYGTDPEYGVVVKVPKAGGMPVRLAMGQGNAFGLAAHPTGLLWAVAGDKRYRETGKIMRLRPGQTMPEVFADKLDWPTSVVADAEHAYWTNLGEIKRAPLAGGVPAVIASAEGQPGVLYDSLVLDGESLYWTDGGTLNALFDDGQIMTVSKAGGTARAIAVNQWSPTGLAVDAGFVYWTTRGTLDESYRDGGVYKKAKSGGPTLPVAENQVEPLGLIVDTRFVYWVTSEGYLRRTPLAGGAPQTLFKAGTAIRGLTQDDTHLYFANEKGTYISGLPPEPYGIWKLAK